MSRKKKTWTLRRLLRWAAYLLPTHLRLLLGIKLRKRRATKLIDETGSGTITWEKPG